MGAWAKGGVVGAAPYERQKTILRAEARNFFADIHKFVYYFQKNYDIIKQIMPKGEYHGTYFQNVWHPFGTGD